MRGVAVVSMFPHKVQKARKRKPQIGFRAPWDLFDYLKEIESRGYEMTAVINRLLYLAKDLETELGKETEKLEKIARTEGISEGKVAARLVKERLASMKSEK